MNWGGGAPRLATCGADSHRGGLCPDKGRARWVALMVQTDKGVRSDSLAFNSRHNTATAAHGPAQTHCGARPSAGRLSGVNPRSDYAALSAVFIWPRSARPPTFAPADALPRLAGCSSTSTWQTSVKGDEWRRWEGGGGGRYSRFDVVMVHLCVRRLIVEGLCRGERERESTSGGLIISYGASANVWHAEAWSIDSSWKFTSSQKYHQSLNYIPVQPWDRGLLIFCGPLQLFSREN